MGTPAARITDMHVCPMVTGIVPHVGGPIALGCFTVITGGMPQARITDMAVCVGPPDVIAMGAFTVLVGGLPAARIGSLTAHGGTVVTGFPTVIIGDGGGGGGGGAGALMAGGPGRVNQASDALSSAPAMIAPWRQAIVYKNAAKLGTPFCERCQK